MEQNIENTENKETKDEQTANLEAEIASLKSQVEKLKASASNASADASKYKKALREAQTAEQNKAQEEAEAKEKLMKELEELRHSKTVTEYTNSFLSMGYSAELAKEKAEAMADGDFHRANEAEKKFLEEQKKALGAEAMRTMGKPPIGTGSQTITAAEIRKEKDPVKRRKLIEEHIDLFE